MDRDALRYVYEDGLQALPTLALVLGYPGFWAKDPATGIDWVKLLHGEQTFELLAPLPASGTVVGTTRVTAIVDKGAGALMFSERDIHRAGQRPLLAVSRSVSFMRGNSSSAPPASDRTTHRRRARSHRTPRPTTSATAPGREAALIYRLSGDTQPSPCRPGDRRTTTSSGRSCTGLPASAVSGRTLLKTRAAGSQRGSRRSAALSWRSPGQNAARVDLGARPAHRAVPHLGRSNAGCRGAGPRPAPRVSVLELQPTPRGPRECLPRLDSLIVNRCLVGGCRRRLVFATAWFCSPSTLRAFVYHWLTDPHGRRRGKAFLACVAHLLAECA